MNKAILAALCTGVALVGVSACGSHDTKVAPPTPTTTSKSATPVADMCALLPAADIERITGLVGAQPEPDATGCNWFANVDPSVSVHANPITESTPAQPCTGFDSQPVAGLGDVACSYVSDQPGGSVAVFRDKGFECGVTVGYAEGNGAKYPVEQAVELAKIVAAKLN